jgi:hypothetical protein
LKIEKKPRTTFKVIQRKKQSERPDVDAETKLNNEKKKTKAKNQTQTHANLTKNLRELCKRRMLIIQNVGIVQKASVNCLS